MFRYLSEYLAVSEFTGCDLLTAVDIVEAAYQPPDEPIAPTTVGNVIYNVPFGQPRPKESTRGTL